MHPMSEFNFKSLFPASHRHAHITPRKARYSMDLIRRQSVNRALEILSASPRRGSYMIKKLLKSAVANAEQHITNDNLSLDINDLWICEARADDGLRVKRFRPRSRGMAHPVLKRQSHLHVVLGTRSEEAAKAADRS